MSKSNAMPIAVVGINALFPGSVNKNEFWRNILAGEDLISDVPETHFSIEDYYDANPGERDKVYCTRGGFLPDVPFDPMEFAIPPGTLSATDTSQLLALRVAKQVLEEAANGQFQSMDRDRISVILGVTSATELVVDLSARIQRPVWEKALRQHGVPEDEVQRICDSIAAQYVPWQEGSFPGLLGNVVAGRIANRLNLGGSNFVTDAACASSLSAVSMAVKELTSYESDVVITGGVDTMNDIFMFMCFTKTPALSRTGDCRPFSHDADGTILGEGIGMVALKRLEDAERDNDPIYAVIRGYGASSDGSAKSVYAPNPVGQAKALRRAYEMAGYGPNTVELMEAHGTGTKAGDVAEFEALNTVFSESGRSDRQWCALGSVKSQIGHTKAAAGAAGLFKAVMALHHKILPPTIKVTQPNPKLSIDDSPFYINTEARPWFAHPNHPRRASLSSFGFGGSNFHLTLEEYTGSGKKAKRLRHATHELFVLSAESRDLLMTRCEELSHRIRESGPEQPLEYYARATQEQHDEHLSARVAIVASSKEDVLTKLEQAVKHLEAQESHFEGQGLYGRVHSNGDAKPRVAFLFPGQGSQYPGMTKHLTMEFDELRRIWEKTALNEHLSELPDVVFPKPAFNNDVKTEQSKRLASIEWAQPAIGAASLTGLRFLQRLGIQPDAVGGHSYGEITALCAAGVFDEDTMLEIAHMRALFMKKAAESGQLPGTMTAVFQDAQALQQLIQQAGLDVVIANRNAPDQCVISGSISAIKHAEQVLKDNDVRFQRLSVAGAFHSPLVASASESFREYLNSVEFSPQDLPVYSNDEGNLFPNNPESIKEQLARQIAQPVDFVKQIRRMVDAGITLFVEVGPSSVLSGLVKRTAMHDAQVHALGLDKKGVHGLDQAYDVLAQLFVHGVPMDLSLLWEDVAPFPASDGTGKKRMDIRIKGSNYGKHPQTTEHALNGFPNYKVVPVSDRNSSQENSRETSSDQSPKDPVMIPPASLPVSLLPSSQESLLDIPLTISPGSQWDEVAVNYVGNGYGQGGTDVNRSIAEAHAMYLKMISESHGLFLQAAAQLPQQNNTYAQSQVTQMPAPPPLLPVQGEVTPVVPSVQSAQPVHQTDHVRGEESDWNPAQDKEATIDPPQDSRSIRDVLLAIVSEKTGYPTDMLDLDADLESGLGIDSIKRVEIFASIQEEIAGLPSLDPDQVTGLHTLSEVESFIESLLAKKKVTV